MIATGQGLLGNNMFAYCQNSPVGFSDPHGYCGSPRGEFAYAGICPVCGASGGGSGGTGGGGIIIGIEEIFTGISEGAAEVAAWTTTASVYAYARTLVDVSEDRFADHQPRVHHIIPRGKFSRYGDDVVAMMDTMHEMLNKADIRINSPENLIVVSQGSHKSMHTIPYIIEIYKIMEPAKDGGRAEVLEALKKARQYVESLDQYRKGW